MALPIILIQQVLVPTCFLPALLPIKQDSIFRAGTLSLPITPTIALPALLWKPDPVLYLCVYTCQNLIMKEIECGVRITVLWMPMEILLAFSHMAGQDI